VTEVDNLAYSLGLPEAWKARLEEAARVELGVEEQSAIARTKVVHLVLITATLIGGVANCRRGDPSGFMLPFVAFLLGCQAGIIDACSSGKPLKETAIDVGKVFVCLIVGFTTFWNFGSLAGAKNN
jgi:hypothetical protein